ncbi:CoA transferase subunit A [Rhodoligotrophos defluvii]|uniref:CoA transferase subunit A n=1 Tax=Rhodoligotrophos defluvii TaxID=2561934 RepID=UPI0010C9A2E8|nr:CoA-transferase [Rhodoligotrophos defluvii]
MASRHNKLASLAEAVSLVKNGQLLALGGEAGRRPPLALICELIRQGRKHLRLAGWEGSIARDLLVAAGCTESVDAGGSIMRNRLRAAALGWPSATVAGLAEAVPALHPDIVLLHAHFADEQGNVRFTTDEWQPEFPDLLLARSARTVIVSVEQVVSAETIASRPTDPFLAGSAVTCIVEAPYGAYPAACEARYAADAEALAQVAQATRSPGALRAWMDEYVFGIADHWAALDRIGARRLMAVSTNRALRS